MRVFSTLSVRADGRRGWVFALPAIEELRHDPKMCDIFSDLAAKVNLCGATVTKGNL